MKITDAREEIVTLTLRQWAVNFFTERLPNIGEDRFKLYKEWMLDPAAEALYRLVFTTPVYMIQEDKVIARLPLTRWDYFLCAIWLDRFAKFEETRLTECLIYSDKSIKLPTDDLKIGNHIHVSTRKTIHPPPPDVEDYDV